MSQSHEDVYLPHLLRDEALRSRHYGADTCSGPPPDMVDQWLLPITLVSSLVCCLVLVVDVILRLRPRPETTHARRRTASALSDYSIDDFECLDMGTANMLFHLQTECNDISAKIDRCAMSLVSNLRPTQSTGSSQPPDTSGLEELALSEDELLEQWENLRWFQQFVGVHMKNAFTYEQYHSQLEQVGSALEEAFRQLHLLLLQTQTEASHEVMTDMASCIHFLVGISSALGRLLEESTQIVPLHQRVKFTGRQEALRVRALCDYQKDGVRNTQGVEGDLPALCCLIPGPDCDTMMQAQSLADYFTSQWEAYCTKFEKALSHYACHALFKASLQDSPLVVPTDTNRLQARHTLSLVERVMTSEFSNHVISAKDRKSSQGVLHQLYELLNGATAREETSAFLTGLEECYILTQKFTKLGDLVGQVAKKSQAIGEHITVVKGRKRPALLLRQSSSSESIQTQGREGEGVKTQQGNHKSSAPNMHQEAGAALPPSDKNSPDTIRDGNTSGKSHNLHQGKGSVHLERSMSESNGPSNGLDPQPESPLGFNRSWSDEESAWFTAPNTPSPRPKVKAFGEPPSPDSKQIVQNVKMLSGNESKNTSKQALNGQYSSGTNKGPQMVGSKDASTSNKRSTVRDSSGITAPGRPRTLGITPRHASLTSNATFGNPTLQTSSTSDATPVTLKHYATFTERNTAEKQGNTTLQRSHSSSSLPKLEKPKRPVKQKEVVLISESESPTSILISGKTDEKSFAADNISSKTHAPAIALLPSNDKSQGAKLYGTGNVSPRELNNEQNQNYGRQFSKSSPTSSTSSTPQSPTPTVYFSCPSSPQIENRPFSHQIFPSDDSSKAESQ